MEGSSSRGGGEKWKGGERGNKMHSMKARSRLMNRWRLYQNKKFTFVKRSHFSAFSVVVVRHIHKAGPKNVEYHRTFNVIMFASTGIFTIIQPTTSCIWWRTMWLKLARLCCCAPPSPLPWIPSLFHYKVCTFYCVFFCIFSSVVWLFVSRILHTLNFTHWPMTTNSRINATHSHTSHIPLWVSLIIFWLYCRLVVGTVIIVGRFIVISNDCRRDERKKNDPLNDCEAMRTSWRCIKYQVKCNCNIWVWRAALCTYESRD